MASESVVEKIVKSLSFEVEAVPRLEDVTKLTSTSNSTPLNVKIRVRKKQDCDMQHGFLSVPKLGLPGAKPERIRVISSDQTIMSFNVSMEADFVRKPKRKPRKLFFGGCLGTQYDDDEIPYKPSSAYNAKITDSRSSSKSDGIIRQKFTLSKTKYDNDNTIQQYAKKQSILGKCKPGGCLDPPFGEEKYSYKPKQKSIEKKPNIMEDTVKTNTKNILAVDGHGTLKETDQLSNDSLIQKVKTDDNSVSIFSLYDNSLQSSVDSKYSDSVITYPPLKSSSPISNDKNSKNKINTEEKLRKSYDDSIEAFFSSPKKTNRFNEKSSNGTVDTKREKVNTIIPIPLSTPYPIVNNTAVSRKDEPHTIATHIQDSISPKEIEVESNISLTASVDKAVLSANDSKLNNFHIKHSSYTDNLVIPSHNLIKHNEDISNDLDNETNITTAPKSVLRISDSKKNNQFKEETSNGTDDSKIKKVKTIKPIPLPISIPLVNNNAVSRIEESHITATQYVQDSISPEKTEVESNTSVSTSVNKYVLSANDSKLNNLHIRNSSYTDNSAIPAHNITKHNEDISNDLFNDTNITTAPNSVLRISDSKKNNQLNEKTSIGTDDTKREKVKTIKPIPLPIVNNNAVSKIDESNITATHVQDSISPKKTEMKSDTSVSANVSTAVLSENDSKLNNLHIRHSSYSINPIVQAHNLTKHNEDISNDLNNDTYITSAPKSVLRISDGEKTSNGLDDTKREKVKTITPIPIPILNNNAVSKIDESHIRATNVQDSISPKEIKVKSNTSVSASVNKYVVSANNSKLNNLHISDSSYTDNSVIPAHNITKHNEDISNGLNNDTNITTAPNSVLRISDSKKNNQHNEKTSIGTDDTKREKVKTIKPIPLPIVNNNAVSKIDESNITATHVQVLISPKETEVESNTSVSASVNKDILSANDSKLNNLHIRHSSYTDNPIIPAHNLTQHYEDISHDLDSETNITTAPKSVFRVSDSKKNYQLNEKTGNGTDDTKGEKVKTVTPVPLPIVNNNAVSKTDESHITETHVQDSISSKESEVKSNTSVTASVNKAVLSANYSKLNNKDSYYTYNLVMPSQDQTKHSEVISNDEDNKTTITTALKSVSREVPMFQSMPADFVSNDTIGPIHDNNDISSYHALFDANENLLDKSSQSKLNDEATAMQDLFKNAKHSLQNSKEEFLNSTPDLKTQLRNNLEDFENRNLIIPNENILQRNGYTPDNHGRKPNNDESPHQPDSRNVVTNPIVKPNTQVDNISEHLNADHVPAKYMHIKNNVSNTKQENLNPVNKLSFENETLFLKDETRTKSITEMITSNKISENSMEPNQKIIENKDNDSKGGDTKEPGLNKDYSKETEFIFEEKISSPDINHSMGTFSHYENNIKIKNDKINDDQDVEPINYNVFSKQVDEEDKNKKNITSDDYNLSLTLERSKIQLSSQNEKLKDSNKKYIKPNQSSFVSVSNGTITNIRTNKTNEEETLGTAIASSKFIDPLKQPFGSTSNQRHRLKDKPSIEQISIQPEQLDSVSSSILSLKLEERWDGQDNAEEKCKASSKTSLKKDSLSLDLAFLSYADDRKQLTLKTIDTSTDRGIYPDGTVTVIKSDLRPNVNEIRIPIDLNNDMTIQIHRTKSPIQRVQIMEQEPLGSKKPIQKLSKNCGLSDFLKVNDTDSRSQEWHEVIAGNKIPSILNSVYEQDLVPLQKTINHLKKEVDSLASQQTSLIAKITSARRAKPIRLLRINSRCACLRK